MTGFNSTTIIIIFLTVKAFSTNVDHTGYVRWPDNWERNKKIKEGRKTDR